MLIRLDKVKATEHIYNVKLGDKTPNGAIVELGGHLDYDAVEGAIPADIDNRLVMVVQEFMDRTGLEVEDEMEFAKDKTVRGYAFEDGGEITITAKDIDGTAVVGEYLVPQVGSFKLKASASKAGSLAFEVLAEEIMDEKKALLLRVVR